MAEEKTNFESLIRRIQKQEILLPDFQRGFVWTDEEKQKRLIASVLAKMPLGSVLLLEADANEYGCKQIGCSTRVDVNSLKNKNIQVLLDGQQRITVLSIIFSNFIFKQLKQISDLVSPNLKRRFFLDISLDESEDIFGIQKLKFPLNNPATDNPDFLTGEVYKYIRVESFTKKNIDEPYHPDTADEFAIYDYCIDGKNCCIPLYLLIDAKENNSDAQIKIGEILTGIVRKSVQKIINRFDSLSDEISKKTYIEGILDMAYYRNMTKDNPLDREKVKEALFQQGSELWKSRMQMYLNACINSMDLHQIIVSKSNRNRAIDIYENLNKGGVTLSTFELVLARAATQLRSDGKNLFEVIVDEIGKKQDYPSYLVPDYVRPNFNTFISKEDYSASSRMNCSLRNELSSKYTDAFLNVLSLLNCNPEYKDSIAFKTDNIKRKAILDISPEFINDNCIRVCRGIDRACFFLQVRCGLRTISELNYSLMLTLIGYIFIKEDNFNNVILHDKLEAWYWSSIFGGEFDKDQTSRIIESINSFVKSLNNNSFSWIQRMKDSMFDAEGFSTKSVLMLDIESRLPKDVIRTSLCQYMLAKTYNDMLSGPKINIFMDDVDKLQEHHIVPIGDINVMLKLADSEKDKDKRQDKTYIANSPLNYAYITEKTNRDISMATIGTYFSKCSDDTLVQLDLLPGSKANTESEVKRLLGERFDRIKTDFFIKVNHLLETN